MYPTPNELSSYSPAWPCAHFRLAGGVNALAGVLLKMLRAGCLIFKSCVQAKLSLINAMCYFLCGNFSAIKEDHQRFSKEREILSAFVNILQRGNKRF